MEKSKFNLAHDKLTEEQLREYINEFGQNNFTIYYWASISKFQKLSEEFIREFADKTNWSWISCKQKLSEEFIREFSNKVDWYSISRYQKLSEGFIKEFQDKLDWKLISYCQKLSKDFVIQFIDIVYWDNIRVNKQISEDIKQFKTKEEFLASMKTKPTPEELKNNKYTEEELRSWIDKFDSDDWMWISQCQKLSEGFIREFANKVCWEEISFYQKLSENFIREFANKVNWQWISYKQELSEDFIREFIIKFTSKANKHYIAIAQCQKLSENFIRQFGHNLDWNEISCYQILSEGFIREFQDKVYWSQIAREQKLSKDFIVEFIDELYWDYLLYNKQISEDIKQFKTKEEFLASVKPIKTKPIKTKPSKTELADNKYTEEELRNWVSEFDYEHWFLVSKYQKLSEDFIREFSNKVDWEKISWNQKLSEGFIREFQDKLNWTNISKTQNLSEEFIREFKDKINWIWISYRQKLSKDFIIEFIDEIHWGNLKINVNISRDIKQFKTKKEFLASMKEKPTTKELVGNKYTEEELKIWADKFNNNDWVYISACQKLSEEFIREFQDKVIWGNISYNQKLSENFIREFSSKVDWRHISRIQQLSKEFIREFQDELNWPHLLENENISEDIKIQLITPEIEEPQMITETKKSFKEIVVDDLHEVKYRLARSQLLDVSRDIVVNILEKENSTKEHAESVKTILNSKAGEAVLSSIVGYGLTYASGDLIEDERIQNIAEEFRINGLHRIEEAIFNIVFEAVTPNIMETLTNSLEELPVKSEEEFEEEFVEVEYDELQYKQV